MHAVLAHCWSALTLHCCLLMLALRTCLKTPAETIAVQKHLKVKLIFALSCLILHGEKHGPQVQKRVAAPSELQLLE